MKKRGNNEAEPKRSSQSHYHECQVTQIALHDTVVLPRQTLDLAWLHCDGHDNSPVFFALGTLGAHAHHERSEVVHAGDVLHHKHDKEPPPTSSALTLYKCFDSLMMLFPGCVMDQSFDVRPSGLAEDDQFYVRCRESTHVPGLCLQKILCNSQLIHISAILKKPNCNSQLQFTTMPFRNAILKTHNCNLKS